MTNEQLCFAVQQGDRAAMDALIEQNMAFLQHTANSLANQSHRPQLADDLIQEGAMGMIRAVEQYDSAREAQFLTYAGYWVRKYMRDYLDAVIDEETVSLDEVVQAGEESAAEHFLSSYAQSPESRLLQAESTEELYHALEKVSERERAYLWYRYGFPDEVQNQTLKDTASHFHLSANRAKATETQSLDNVRLELPWWY